MTPTHFFFVREQGVPNNYETDLIFPIVSKAAALAGIAYGEADAQTKTALKVIGDHTRAVTYLISDGVTPSNVGRGYVVRRLLRRVVMKVRLDICPGLLLGGRRRRGTLRPAAGATLRRILPRCAAALTLATKLMQGRLLGIKQTFTPAVAEVAISLSAACDPQVQANASRVLDVLAQEEAMFSATLDRGSRELQDMLERVAAAAGKVLAGKDAFLLYDSFGFPLELTQELAEQRGVQVRPCRPLLLARQGANHADRSRATALCEGLGVDLAIARCFPLFPAQVDVAGFEVEMAAQRSRSKESREQIDLTAQSALAELAGSLPVTEFVGYTELKGAGTVQAVLVNGRPVDGVAAGGGDKETVEVLLDSTPFYAESGARPCFLCSCCSSLGGSLRAGRARR